MFDPLIETFSEAVAAFVFTITTTTSVGLLYADRKTPDIGLAVASTRLNPGRMNFENSPCTNRAC